MDLLGLRLGIETESTFRSGEEHLKGIALDTACVRCYLTPMNTTVSTKGQIVLPADIRRQDDIRPGQSFEIERIDRGEYRLRRKARRRNEGLVDLLLACPVKGWFRPMDRTETTDDLVLTDLA